MTRPFPLRALLLPALLLPAACGKPQGDGADQPGVASNILDQALPNAQQADPPANAITPVESAPVLPAPPPPAAPDGLVPVALQGRWTGPADRCGDRAAALELTVAPDSLIFHESAGTVESVREGDDGATLVTAAFTGEGQSWTRTLTLRPSGDGRALTIINDGAAVTRKRC